MTAGEDAHRIELLDLHPEVDTFLDDVVAGLSAPQKTLPCKYLYDKRGSALFDRICELEEYYVTRTELAIMRANLREIAEAIGHDPLLIEFGSGSSLKTRLLLDALREPHGYVPVDISRQHLLEAAESLREEFPRLPIHPVCADFNDDVRVPKAAADADRRVMYFPGSTIGNFTPSCAGELLELIRRLIGPRGALLIGIDLKKDRATLEAAYDDAEGVTAAFNLNILHRINRELGADFDVEAFEHRAVYVPQRSRVEMHLVARTDQSIAIDGRHFRFRSGETIHTESSHKWSLEQFESIAATSGFATRKHWTDPETRFAVILFEAA
jgi:dimethylhistidine N-methyltransferase